MKNRDMDGLRCLNRDVIKYIAMFTMFLNHFAEIFLEGGGIFQEVLTDIGYFTAITMCYFLAEGYEYTRSKKKYGIRLFVFACISEFPFCFAFGYSALNMLFTLFFCFLILVAREKINNIVLRIFVIFLLIMVTINCDWPLMAAIFTVLFAKYKNDQKKLAVSYGIAYLIFVIINLTKYEMLPLPSAIFHSALGGIGLLISGLVILFLYNGKRAEYGRKFSKWFFYIFYPAHLLILGLIHNFM